ncbi:MAG TPA: cupin domain-containing protein [Caulobacterales bacterium]|nr:cupin domain-containing protein [Caulobacterales bacterium]
MSDKWRDDPLGRLIGPERIGDFFARVYEREALIVAHGDGARFADLISIAAVDRIVTGVDLKEGQLDLANAARQLMKSDYLDSAGYVDRGAVAELFAAGSTIILQQAHQLDPQLGAFCRGLERVFSSHVQTNIYLTPANAQGFRTHFDNHDVFVLQISGEKAWRLYDVPVDTPYRGEQFRSAEHPAGELRREFVLRAGDCAYVPRGMMHDAISSGAEPSLHVTVGLITRTWADLMLEAISEVALRRVEFRRSLPAGFARADFDREAARARLKELAAIAGAEIKLDPALELLIDDFIRSRPADNAGAIVDAGAPIAPTDRFRARNSAPFRLAEDGESVALIAPGGDLGFAQSQRAALERALSGAVFTTAELGEGAEKLVQRLLTRALIERV